jgi:hypothetical protein
MKNLYLFAVARNIALYIKAAHHTATIEIISNAYPQYCQETRAIEERPSIYCRGRFDMEGNVS